MEKELTNEEEQSTESLSAEIMEANSIHSEEVQDLVGAVPHWLVRSGISLMGLVLSIFFVISWFVKYPDVLIANILITTNPSPTVLVARSSGPVALLKKENEQVEKGEIIAIIQSSVDWNEVLKMERQVVSGFDQGAFQKLGDLQPRYNQYRSAKMELKLLQTTKNYAQQISGLRRQLLAQETLEVNLEKQLQLSKKQLALASDLLRTDSLLYSQRVISKVDFQQKKNGFLQVSKEFEQIEAATINQKIRIEELGARLMKVERDETTETNRYEQLAAHTRNELLAAVENWKKLFLIVSEQLGIISYLDILQDGKFINANDRLFSVIPKAREILAIASLPAVRSGKVEIGQKVNIKLDQYPYSEYGMLIGEVKTISLITVENNYKIAIELPNGLTTTYGKTLDIRLDLTGQTEIITEDVSLMERMFHWVKELKGRF